MLYAFAYVKAINSSRLEVEIRASAIQAALDHIVTAGTAVTIYFKAALSLDDTATLSALVAAHVNTPLPYATPPSDNEDAPIVRLKAAAPGWYFQIHSVEFTTAKYGGFYSKKVDAATGVETDTGFCTHKIYDAAGAEITSGAGEGNAVHTRIDWQVNHDMEIRGSMFTHAEKALQDCRMWVFAAPGIVNIPFAVGGLNLRHLPSEEAFTAEGGTAKFLSATVPMVGVNKFRLLLKHPAGFQHMGQLHFMLYKA
jgi:hypothetical protein